MYEAYFGLREKPFNLAPDPAYFFLSSKHRDVLDHLLYTVREREGFAVFTGEVGTGKTTVCRTFLNTLPPQVTSALVLNPLLSEDELLRAIVQDFGLQPEGATKKGLIDQLNDFLLASLAEGRNAVLIIDEAQNLSSAVLEQIRILSNLETEKEKLLQIILVGQAELRDKLERPELRQLNQRVSIRFHLDPLSPTETREYVDHRLQVAGAGETPRFTRKAVDLVYAYSGGVPRRINLLCDRALLRAFVEQEGRVTPRMVRLGRRSLSGEDAAGISRRRFSSGRPLAAAGLSAAVILAGGIYALGVWSADWVSRREATSNLQAEAVTSTSLPSPGFAAGPLPGGAQTNGAETGLAPPGRSGPSPLHRGAPARPAAATTAPAGPPAAPLPGTTAASPSMDGRERSALINPARSTAPGAMSAAEPQPEGRRAEAPTGGSALPARSSGTLHAPGAANPQGSASRLTPPAAPIAAAESSSSARQERPGARGDAPRTALAPSLRRGPAAAESEPLRIAAPSVSKPQGLGGAAAAGIPTPPRAADAAGRPAPPVAAAAASRADPRLPGTLAERLFKPDPRFPFTVHLGSYRSAENALEAAGVLEQRGYTIYVAIVSAPRRGEYYRILVGRYASKREAVLAAKQLRLQATDEPRVLESRRAVVFQ
ncbi:MAG: AAA family ATPase [Candidatus Tectomicrobia bacterium]|nr:AAA family ATPase [Candidatus Tectomicrobia bacterium]